LKPWVELTSVEMVQVHAQGEFAQRDETKVIATPYEEILRRNGI
jgi:hypothetical protein